MSFVNDVKAEFKTFESTFFGRVTLSFVRAFLGVFIVGVLGIASNLANTHDWNAGKAALVALVSAAIVAGIRAAQSLLVGAPTKSEVKTGQ